MTAVEGAVELNLTDRDGDVSGADVLDATGVLELLVSVLEAASEPVRGTVVTEAVWVTGCRRGPSVKANVTCFVSPSRSRF